MAETASEMIDIFTHISPGKYDEKLWMKAKYTVNKEINSTVPALVDLDKRFEIMDRFNGYRQILTVVQPSLETVIGPEDAVDLSRLANDEMAELVLKYPDRFAGAVACLPMNNVDASIKEAERAIRDLNFKGIQLYTPVDGKPLDCPEFMDIYDMMSGFDLPIWVHPTGEASVPDYVDEKESKYGLYASLGWPYQTSLGMARLVFSGVLDKYPDIKFVVHHCGAMISFFINRLNRPRPGLKELPENYFRKFFVDTAVDNKASLMCGHSFWGDERIIFGTDSPFGGAEKVAKCMSAVSAMDISDNEKDRIFCQNARRLLKLNM